MSSCPCPVEVSQMLDVGLPRKQKIGVNNFGFEKLQIGARQKGDSKWEKPVSAKICGFPAKICGFLRFSARICDSRIPWFTERAENQGKSAKICENVRSGSGFSLLLSPFWRALIKVTVERNADDFGREFWAWMFFGEGGWNPGKTRLKKFAGKFRWGNSRRNSPAIFLKFAGPNFKNHPNPLCRTSGLIDV